MGISELLKRVDISHSENENKNRKLSQDEKLDEILAQLKALCIVVSQHDQHLTAVNNNLLKTITELMERKKEISRGKKLEAEDIIKRAKDRTEAIEKLKSIGISQATAYRYTKIFEEEKKEAVEESSENKE
jgi:Na+/phosphate symporter